MNEKPAAQEPFDTQREIVGGHVALKQLLDRLETTEDPRKLLEIIGELNALLTAHFRAEESATGLHEIISENAPQCLTQLQRLFDDHRVLLETVESVSCKLESYLRGPERIREEVTDLCRKLREHEAEESRLLTESLYTDLGRSS